MQQETKMMHLVLENLHSTPHVCRYGQGTADPARSHRLCDVAGGSAGKRHRGLGGAEGAGLHLGPPGRNGQGPPGVLFCELFNILLLK